MEFPAAFLNEIPSPYREITEKSYENYLSQGVNDSGLRNYFSECFDAIVKELGLYACWVCPSCLAKGTVTFGWGEKTDPCPRCGRKTYAVGTFQAWAPATGKMFEWAFWYLIKRYADIRLVPSTSNLYDFQFLPKEPEVIYLPSYHNKFHPKTAIEAKGSPSHIKNPDGSLYNLGRPGLERSDTEKKAFANAKEFRKQNPDSRFFIVTNALPDHLRGYTNRDVTRVRNISYKSELDAFVQELTTT